MMKQSDYGTRVRVKMAEAERMYQRALEGREKVWGPEHTSTLDTVNNLTALYSDQGKMDASPSSSSIISSFIHMLSSGDS